jgi:hypothetical protein
LNELLDGATEFNYTVNIGFAHLYSAAL